ncbi:hypothetical protein Y032_0002g567 [Ancylostoma ceylanicum]|uniref:Uncharacterized protein n=1 Tax=Ancylostoma ceylanicum TaxID=53326 RepID=A0A016W092_9BILA|nr:hypothetical protein Y032_0002g567 [Ancylostoma ceylanicum]
MAETFEIQQELSWCNSLHLWKNDACFWRHILFAQFSFYEELDGIPGFAREFYYPWLLTLTRLIRMQIQFNSSD